jgi:small subunit ribosomal protein S11
MSEDKAQKAKKEEEIKEDSKLEEVVFEDEKEIDEVLKKEENKKGTKKSKKNTDKAEGKADEDEEESDIFSSAADEELPEEIKAKLEKNKLAREKVNKKKQKKKKKKGPQAQVKIGKAFIKATYNNTIVTLTDLQGGVISWASAGVAGFKGPKKATPYAAQIITKIATMKAKEEYGLKEVAVFASGVGTGKESAIRALNANGLEVTAIKDVTAVPHNGCRPKKPRRV